MGRNPRWLGTVFIVAGLVLLLNKLGVLNWDIWWRLVQIWPVFFISIGLTMVFGRGRLSWLGPLVLIAAFVYAIAAPSVPDAAGHRLFTATAESEVSQGQLELSIGAGSIEVAAGDELAQAAVYSRRAPIWEHDVSAGRAIVRLSSSRAGQNRVVSFGPSPQWSADLQLSRAIPWDIRLDCGAGSVTANLREIKLSSLTAKTGAGKLDLVLGTTDRKVDVMLEGGVSSVQVQVPKNMPLRVTFAGGIKSSSISNLDLVQQGETWVSPDWSSASFGYDLNISTGIGKLVITGYNKASSI